MPHQINLLPATAGARAADGSASLVRALLILALGLAAASGWMEWNRRQTLETDRAAAQRHAAEMQRLRDEQARAAGLADPRALELEVAAARAALSRLQQEFALRAAADSAPAAWLDWLARHRPPQAWLQRVRAGGGRIDIEGYTLAPAELGAWLDRMANESPQAPMRLTGLRLEQRELAPWGTVFWFEFGAGRWPGTPAAERGTAR